MTINDYKRRFLALAQEMEDVFGCRVSEVRVTGDWKDVTVYSVPRQFATPDNTEIRDEWQYDVTIEF